MLNVNSMTEEQINKVRKYNRFYSDTLVKSFEDLRAKKHQIVEKKPYYEAYYNIVLRVSILIRNLGIKDPLCASVIFEYLLWNGYLSINHKLIYSIQGRVNELALTGADIMRGKSVCLNNACMLSDVLRELGYKAYTFGCQVKTTATTTELEYRPDIKRNVADPTLKEKIMSHISSGISTLGNHAVTLIDLENNLVLADPTSLAFLNLNDFLKAKYVGSNLETKLKPWISLVLENISKTELDSIVYRTIILSDKKLLSTKLVRDIGEVSLDICKKHQDILEDFHEESKKDINTVCKTIKKK